MGFTNQQLNVQFPEDNNAIEFKVPESEIVIYLAPDLANGEIPTLLGANETDVVTVNVSHVVSIVLPLQPEWWLQLVQNVGGNDETEEMEDEICK